MSNVTQSVPILKGSDGQSDIDGVLVHHLTVNRDSRGTLTELLRTDWPGVFGETMPFAQAYVSITEPGVARDEDRWHVHQLQTDRFYCIAGRIVIAIYDARVTSPTYQTLMLVELDAERDAPAPALVTIPPGTLHGFVVTSEVQATLLNFPNKLYDPDDEGRVPFEQAAVLLPDGNRFSYDYVRNMR